MLERGGKLSFASQKIRERFLKLRAVDEGPTLKIWQVEDEVAKNDAGVFPKSDRPYEAGQIFLCLWYTA